MRRFRITLLVAALCHTRIAGAAEKVIPSVFFISKSENRNQVHYALSVDQNCRAMGDTPVRPYWRDFETSSTATSPLLSREEPAYGISAQRVHSRSEFGSEMSITLRAVPKRPLRIRTTRDSNGNCRAIAFLTIENVPARLYSIHVALAFLRVDAIFIKGWALSDGRTLREKVER